MGGRCFTRRVYRKRHGPQPLGSPGLREPSNPQYTDEPKEEIRDRVNMISSAVKTKTMTKKEGLEKWQKLTIAGAISTVVTGIISAFVVGAWKK